MAAVHHSPDASPGARRDGGGRPARRRAGAGLFVYECARILLLIVFWFIAVPDGPAYGDFFPYLVYLSANALFPLMALFAWLRPEEYGNYLDLYMAGKAVASVSFFVWALISPREFSGMENIVKNMALLGGCFLVGMADILSVWRARTLAKKPPKGSSPGPAWEGEREPGLHEESGGK